MRHSRNAIVICAKRENPSPMLRNSGDLISKCIPSLSSEASTLILAHQGLTFFQRHLEAMLAECRYFKKLRNRKPPKI